MSDNTFLSRWFLAYIAPVTLGLAVGLVVVHLTGMHRQWAFVTGLGMSVPIEMYRDWLQSYEKTREELEAVNG